MLQSFTIRNIGKIYEDTTTKIHIQIRMAKENKDSKNKDERQDEDKRHRKDENKHVDEDKK